MFSMYSVGSSSHEDTYVIVQSLHHSHPHSGIKVTGSHHGTSHQTLKKSPLAETNEFSSNAADIQHADIQHSKTDSVPLSWLNTVTDISEKSSCCQNFMSHIQRALCCCIKTKTNRVSTVEDDETLTPSLPF